MVEPGPSAGTDPYGLELRVPNWSDYPLFQRLLDQLCPEGHFQLSYWWGVVSSPDTYFCLREPIYTRVFGTIYPGCTTTTRITDVERGRRHPVACKCICDAVNADFTIKLYSRAAPGGAASIVGNRSVWVGPARPLGYVGHSDSRRPAAGRVRADQWIIFGHELCGHAVPGLAHPADATAYTLSDPVIQIENRLRFEHFAPGDDYGVRTG